MQTLSRELRKELERAIVKARNVAEAGARKAIKNLAVHDSKPWDGMGAEERTLRNRLRAHGRQLGDIRDTKKVTQSVEKLVTECAYEHWHRMLFARFLAENDLLIEPETGVAISLEDCQELARGKGEDWIELASSFAEQMLPQIFRKGDPVLELILPPESRSELEEILKGLSRNIFLADDSLGWVYQFWQVEKKKQINASEKKIGAEELPAVTQLFTEDYMVQFLLHNTLGAWWAGKYLKEHPEVAREAKDENELRTACTVGNITWDYLRFVREEGDLWRPAAGTFDGWPKTAKEVTVLDPCMGSGHFLVFALPILVALRMKEEGLSKEAAIDAVLEENLYGLEIDARCTQIAAFNLALAAWRITGFKVLPPLNLACSGLAIGVSKKEWLSLAERIAVLAKVPVKKDLFKKEENLFPSRVAQGLEKLYDLFEKAPTLGSLIDPRAAGEEDLLDARFDELEPFLKPIFEITASDEISEMAVTARGISKAAEILSRKFSLVITNVPYLKGGEHGHVLKEYCEDWYPQSKYDLATVFIERCHRFLVRGGHLAIVTQQYWLFLKYYEGLRETMLLRTQIPIIARLGPCAFEQISGEVVSVCLQITCQSQPDADSLMVGLEVDDLRTPKEKQEALPDRSFILISQFEQLKNPDKRIILTVEKHTSARLSSIADFGKGSVSGDGPHYLRKFWEADRLTSGRKPWLNSPSGVREWSGREHFILWGEGGHNPECEIGFAFRGQRVFKKLGVALGKAGKLRPTLYSGELFDDNMAVIASYKSENALAVWVFCNSERFEMELRKLDKKMSVTAGTFTKVPFDLAYWKAVAAEQYPHGLPNPFSSDPTQWLFNGHPKGADQLLQVAVARLLGYQWPRQTGSSFPDCPALDKDGLEKHADDDGIVCLTPLRGEQAAAARLRSLLADAFGSEWSLAKQNELLASVEFSGKSLDDWLREGFFEQHCKLFHQRPFIWHIWDGRRDGFNVLVNYHKLAGPKGGGKRTLEKLIYTYLGDWIEQQRRDQKNEVEGADARLTVALRLKEELEKIRIGEPPYDLFVRWKLLREQAMGWEPDINDGVRLNIRPFMTAKPLETRAASACILRTRPKIKWDKDRGKEPARDKSDYPWFWGWDGSEADFVGGRNFDGNRWNNLHYTNNFKNNARAASGSVVTQ